MSNLNVVDFPVANNPSFDAVQALPLNLHRIGLDTLLLSGESTTFSWQETTKLLEITVLINSEDALDYLQVSAVDAGIKYLVPGTHYYHVLGLPFSEISFDYYGNGEAMISVMEV